MTDTALGRGALARYALLGTAIAFAGPPIYIHAPSFYTDVHGLDLATVGAVLLAVRAVDFVQDPALGHLVARTHTHRALLASVFGGVLIVGVAALFAPTTPLPPGAWLAIASVLVFTGFSGLQILFYSTGLGLADVTRAGHAGVAAWREAGVFAGICAAAAAPTLLNPDPRVSYTLYAGLFVLGLIAALTGMRRIWSVCAAEASNAVGFRALFRDRPMRALFGIGLLNTLPVGLTSTLFLFYVNDRLDAPNHAGPLLLVFFLTAGAAAPLWGRIGAAIGLRRALLIGMALAILMFSFALPLGAGDWPAFYIVSALSGAAMSADLTLLPALLSARLAHLGANGGYAFGVWGFLTKASLALAAGTALPALALAGYAPGADQGDTPLLALSIAYAAVPCVLKVFAIIALALAPIPQGEPS